MRYGNYTVQTQGNGNTVLVTRDGDLAECFMQGDDAGLFLDFLAEFEAADMDPSEYISHYFLGVDEAGGWEAYKAANGW